MASFTDQISQFNPYIQQLPVDAMVKVGMQKQAQYDQGVQKIQGYIDNIAGMDVMRDVDKQHLQSKLNELGSRLKTVAAGDFSNAQLVNSVGGMATQIVKDPYVQAAVQSTANARKQLSLVNQAREKGELTPDNEWFFMDKQLNQYLSNPSLAGEKNSPVVFNGKYIKHYDVDKDIQEAIGKAHLSSNEWEENALNPDGSVNSDILIEKAKKGLLSGKVKSIVESVFSKPEVQQQLAITGTYQFKDYTPEMLKSVQDESINYIRNKAKENRDRIACVGVISDYESANANRAIIDIDNQLQSSEEQYAKYMKLLNEGRIDEAKISLYRDNKEAQYQNDYSWEENSMKSKVNPWFTVQMTRANYNLAVQKEKFDEGDANRKFNEGVRQFDLDYGLKLEDAQRKRDIANNKLNPDGSSKLIYTKEPISPDEVAKIGSQSYKNNTQLLKDQANQLQAKVISTLPGFEDLYRQDDNGVYKFNYAKYKDWKTVEPKYRMALVELEKAHMNGTVSPNYRQDVEQMHDLQSLVSLKTQTEKEIDDRYKPLIDKIANQISDPKPMYGKSTMPISKTDMVNVWLAQNSKDPQTAQTAKDYINTKYGKGGGAFSDKKADGVTLLSGIYKDSFKQIDKVMSDNPGLAPMFANREKDYKKAQQQNGTWYATINEVKPEGKLLVNKKYNALLARVMGGEKTGGVYGEMAKMLSAKSPAELNENLYGYFRGQDGQWYAQIRRNLGSGEGYKYSEMLPISPEEAAELGAKTDPLEEAFDSKFGGYLNNFQGKQTAKNLISPEAENTALNRKSVGQYSVGFQLKELNGGYVPYVYVRDRNGNVLSSGMELDFSVYSKDPRLTPIQRERFKDVQSIMSKADVVTKLPLIDENLITLMLNNNR